MTGFVSSIQTINATIANAGTTSDAIDCNLLRPSRLSLPTAFTGTAVTFTVPSSADSSVYQPLYNPDGTIYTVTVAAGREVALPPADFVGVEMFKIVSNAAEGAARVIGVICTP